MIYKFHFIASKISGFRRFRRVIFTDISSRSCSCSFWLTRYYVLARFVSISSGSYCCSFGPARCYVVTRFCYSFGWL